jgi:hypothetical protein
MRTISTARYMPRKAREVFCVPVNIKTGYANEDENDPLLILKEAAN